jgi:hypothetical protein
MSDPVNSIVEVVRKDAEPKDAEPADAARSFTELKFISKRQPWMEFIQIPQISEQGLGLRNEDEVRIFDECDDKRLGG